MFREAAKRFSVAATVATEAAKSAASTAAASAVKPVMEPKRQGVPILSRFRAFVGGAVFASAVGMYVIAFQLQGLLDEVKSAVHDVSIRQAKIETKLSKLSYNGSEGDSGKTSE